ATKAKKSKSKSKKNGDATSVDVAAPDEPLDDGEQIDTGAGRGPTRFVWKQHPSIRFGKVLRLDFEAKFQKDGRTSDRGARESAGVDPLELHRNRVGVQGTLFKHIEFEVERELTEKELTERELAQNLTPLSPWKDVYVNVDYIGHAQVQAG